MKFTKLRGSKMRKQVSAYVGAIAEGKLTQVEVRVTVTGTSMRQCFYIGRI